MTTPEPNGTLRYQVAQHERRLEKLEAFEPAVLRASLAEMVKDIEALDRKIDAQAEYANKRMASVSNRLLGLAFSIAVAAVIFALTATGVWGH